MPQPPHIMSGVSVRHLFPFAPGLEKNDLSDDDRLRLESLNNRFQRVNMMLTPGANPRGLDIRFAGPAHPVPARLLTLTHSFTCLFTRSVIDLKWSGVAASKIEEHKRGVKLTNEARSHSPFTDQPRRIAWTRFPRRSISRQNRHEPHAHTPLVEGALRQARERHRSGHFRNHGQRLREGATRPHSHITPTRIY